MMEFIGIVGFIALFLAAVLVIWERRHKPHFDGKLVAIRDDDGKLLYSLELDVDLEEIEFMDYITLQVSRRVSDLYNQDNDIAE
jgi:hypothetical protein